MYVNTKKVKDRQTVEQGGEKQGGRWAEMKYTKPKDETSKEGNSFCDSFFLPLGGKDGRIEGRKEKKKGEV